MAGVRLAADQEDVYQRYRQRDRQRHMDCFLACGALIGVHSGTSVLLSESSWASWVFATLCIAASAAALCAAACRRNQRWPLVITYVGWLLVNSTVVGLAGFTQPSRWMLTWLLLVNCLTSVTLPVRLPVCCALTFSTTAVFVATSATQNDAPQQVSSNFCLISFPCVSVPCQVWPTKSSQSRRMV